MTKARGNGSGSENLKPTTIRPVQAQRSVLDTTELNKLPAILSQIFSVDGRLVSLGDLVKRWKISPDAALSRLLRRDQARWAKAKKGRKGGG